MIRRWLRKNESHNRSNTARRTEGIPAGGLYGSGREDSPHRLPENICSSAGSGIDSGAGKKTQKEKVQITASEVPPMPEVNVQAQEKPKFVDDATGAFYYEKPEI